MAEKTTSDNRPLIGVDLRSLVGQTSGIGFYTLALLRQLATSDRARYVGMAHRRVEAEAGLRELGIDLDYRAAPLGVLWQQLLLPRRIDLLDIDLFWSPLFILPPRLKVPGVVTIHDLTPVLYPEMHRLRVRLSSLPFLESTLRRASRVIVDSRSTADDVRRHFPESTPKLEVIYPGIDPDFVPASESEIEATRQELGCPAGYIFFAGTIEPRKNLAPLLDAWEELRRQNSATPPLVLAGPYGWHSRDLVRRLETLRESGVKHLGPVDRGRLVRLFQAARVFVMPSLYEGFGLPAAEAMASGVPTVVSNRSSLPEVVGDAGLLVDVDDGSELAHAISRVLTESSLAEELKARGLERARRFVWADAAKRVEEVFFESLASSSPNPTSNNRWLQ